MYATDKKRYFWVGFTALLQGVLLWLAFSGQTLIPLLSDFGARMSASSVPLAITLLVPVSLWLSQDHWGRRLVRFISGLFAVLVIFRLYSIWSMSPVESNTSLGAVCLAVFFLLPYFQCRIASWSWHVPYSEMFFQFCRNLFLLFQGSVAAGMFWLLLRISAGLFEITGFTLLAEYIFDPLVFYVLTSFVVAVAVTLGLKRPGIDSVGRWILSILAWLLPPFALVSIVFIGYLPFSGLKPLLDTGQASTLMLFLQLSLIGLANTAWLDGSRVPFAIPINAVAQAGLLTLPFYASLCIYSLGLRVAQYGWSVDRFEAAGMLAIVALWGLGYALMVVLRKWPKSIGRVNLFVVVIFCVFVMLTNTPMMDPRRLTTANQVSRLLEDSIKPSDFDFRYMRFNLGRYGYEALEQLKTLRGTATEIRISAKAIDALLMTAEDRVPPSLRVPTEEERYVMLAEAEIMPGDKTVSDEVRAQIVDVWGTNELSFLRNPRGGQFAFVFVGERLVFSTPSGIAIYEISGDVLSPVGSINLREEK